MEIEFTAEEALWFRTNNWQTREIQYRNLDTSSFEYFKFFGKTPVYAFKDGGKYVAEREIAYATVGYYFFKTFPELVEHLGPQGE